MKRAVCTLIIALHATAIGPAYAKPEKSDSEKAQESAVVSARKAFEYGRLPELERLSARSQGHLLAFWPDYWRLKIYLGVPQADARSMRQQVLAFLDKYADHPLKENIHRDWIQALVSKQQWDEVASVLNTLPAPVGGAPATAVQAGLPQMACARARVALRFSADAPAQAEKRLVSGAEKPTPTADAELAIGNESLEACISLIDVLSRNQQVSPAYLRQRVRWVAQTGTESAHFKLMEIAKAYAKAQDAGARGADFLKNEHILGKILKASRTDSQTAHQFYRQYRHELSPEQRSYAQLAVGSAIWRKSDRNSWDLMQEGWESRHLQPDDVLVVAAREALRRQRWPRVLEAISAMREASQQEPVWQYWKAVALRETGAASQSQAVLHLLKHDFGFYGLLAKEALNEPVMIPASKSITLTDADRTRLNADRGMQRSYALLRLNMRAEAVAEWSASMRGRNDAELLRAALHARESGFLDRTIAAADRTLTEHDFSLRYPMAFKEAVLPAAEERDLSPWWVLGLIRQESRFIPDVKSSVGATGLMQIMPATGRMLAKNLGVKQPASVKLTDVQTNVKLGTSYMRELKDRFGGSALLASAAYNAGPSRAVSWRSALPSRIDGAAFAESIPFAETRDYVKRVLTNAVLYHAVHMGGPAPSLKGLLGEVVPNESL